MLNFNSISAILGLVALGAMTSCSIKEDVSGCPKQQITISLNMLLTSEEQTIPVTTNAYDASGTIITTLTLSNVPMKRNRVTTARGTLFNAGGAASFTFENNWLDQHEMNF